MVKNQTTHHQHMREQIRAFCAQQDIPLFPVEIPASIRAADAAGAGVPLTRYGGSNEAKAAYQELAALLFPPPALREVAHA
jgi:cellulose biosynthesis protein BcsQ